MTPSEDGGLEHTPPVVWMASKYGVDESIQSGVVDVGHLGSCRVVCSCHLPFFIHFISYRALSWFYETEFELAASDRAHADVVRDHGGDLGSGVTCAGENGEAFLIEIYLRSTPGPPFHPVAVWRKHRGR